MAASVMAASIAAARPPRKRLRHAADCGGPRRLLWARSMTHAAPAPAPETLRVPKTRITCDGTGDGLPDAAPGHPRAWLGIDPDAAHADCRYCVRRSEEHTSELQSLMPHSYSLICSQK